MAADSMCFKDAILTPEKVVYESVFTTSSLEEALTECAKDVEKITSESKRVCDSLALELLNEFSSDIHGVVGDLQREYGKYGFLNDPDMTALFGIIGSNITVEYVVDDDEDIFVATDEDDILGAQNT